MFLGFFFPLFIQAQYILHSVRCKLSVTVHVSESCFIVSGDSKGLESCEIGYKTFQTGSTVAAEKMGENISAICSLF